MTVVSTRYISANSQVGALTGQIGSPDLARALDDLLLLTGGPEDLRCLLYVTEALQRGFDGRVCWTRVKPFSAYQFLAEQVNAKASMLVGKYPHLKPPPKVQHRADGTTTWLNPMYGYIEKHPLWAMLCAASEDEDLRTNYALLQMHILYARLREAFHKAGEREQTLAVILSATENDREMRIPIELGKAVRRLSTFAGLLKALDSCLSPPLFRKHLESWTDSVDSEAGSIFTEIFNHVVVERGARHGGQGSKGSKGFRKVCRKSHPEHIEHGADRIRFAIEDHDEDGLDSGATYRLSTPTDADDPNTDNETRNKEQHKFTSPLDAARKLGLHPAELGSLSGIHANVPGAKNTGDAKQIARARWRSREINRSLMPWSSDHLSLREFHRAILPTLETALTSPEMQLSDLKSAVLVALSIDSGRKMEDVIELAVEPKVQMASFSYQPPSKGRGDCGIWKWDAIAPEYESIFEVPQGMQMALAPFLRYPASRLVTELVDKYRRMATVRTVLFRSENDDVAEALRWIKRRSGCENVTPGRLAGLRWQALHQVTGGELASSCLILGQRAHLASVEMHYAVLEVTEARAQFDQSSEILWGEPPTAFDLPDSADSAVVGARAVPRVSLVKEKVSRLKAASKQFFAISPHAFEPQHHGELLNAAVLYTVWHQFFSFATRSIQNAYQESSRFARHHQVAILSDKDFEDHHKTRLILANKRLLDHMKAIEQRLDAIRKHLKSHRFPKNSPLFFLDDGKRALRITPKTVEDQLGDDFPFEVNAPRKLMRFLVRKAGLSHEDAEVYMGHWWEAREPWSPFSSFDWPGYLARINAVVPAILDSLGFTWIPGEEPR